MGEIVIFRGFAKNDRSFSRGNGVFQVAFFPGVGKSFRRIFEMLNAEWQRRAGIFPGSADRAFGFWSTFFDFSTLEEYRDWFWAV
jgi:hypothetical protein